MNEARIERLLAEQRQAWARGDRRGALAARGAMLELLRDMRQ